VLWLDGVDVGYAEANNIDIDTSIPGEYSIVYTAIDSSGNEGTTERVVIVSAPEVVEVVPLEEDVATCTPPVEEPQVEEPPVEPPKDETATTTPTT